jgi:hypothetical protein
MGAQMMCSFSTDESALVVLPTNKIFTNQVPDANIMDHVPMVNIMPFGMCNSPMNPDVALAMAPVPCVPVTPDPWVPGAPMVVLGNFPTLDNVSQLLCAWGGVITFVTPGELTVGVP